MKTTLVFANVVVPIAILALGTACQTTPGTSSGSLAQKEAMLAQAGFKTKKVVTAKQQQRVSALPAGQVSAVKYRGKRYHVYTNPAKDHILVGNDAQYNAYMAKQQMTGPVFQEETHGQNPVLIQEFDGFGPLGD